MIDIITSKNNVNKILAVVSVVAGVLLVVVFVLLAQNAGLKAQQEQLEKQNQQLNSQITKLNKLIEAQSEVNSQTEDASGNVSDSNSDKSVAAEVGRQLGDAAKAGKDFIESPETQQKLKDAGDAIKKQGQSFVDGFLDGYGD